MKKSYRSLLVATLTFSAALLANNIQEVQAEEVVQPSETPDVKAEVVAPTKVQENTEVKTPSISVSAPVSNEKVEASTPTSASASSEKVETSTPTSAPASSEKVGTSTPTSAPASSEKVETSTPTSAPVSSEKVEASTSTSAPASSEKVETSTSISAPVSSEKVEASTNATQESTKVEKEEVLSKQDKEELATKVEKAEQTPIKQVTKSEVTKPKTNSKKNNTKKLGTKQSIKTNQKASNTPPTIAYDEGQVNLKDKFDINAVNDYLQENWDNLKEFEANRTDMGQAWDYLNQEWYQFGKVNGSINDSNIGDLSHSIYNNAGYGGQIWGKTVAGSVIDKETIHVFYSYKDKNGKVITKELTSDQYDIRRLNSSDWNPWGGTRGAEGYNITVKQGVIDLPEGGIIGVAYTQTAYPQDEYNNFKHTTSAAGRFCGDSQIEWWNEAHADGHVDVVSDETDTVPGATITVVDKDTGDKLEWPDSGNLNDLPLAPDHNYEISVDVEDGWKKPGNIDFSVNDRGEMIDQNGNKIENNTIIIEVEKDESIPMVPIEPSTPVTPEEPTTPEKPEEPTEPVTPEEPTTPEKPEVPNKPIIPNEPSYPGYVDVVTDESETVPGTTITVTDKETGEKFEWPDSGNLNELPLVPGHDYVVSVDVPEGFEKTSDVIFKVDENGKMFYEDGTPISNNALIIKVTPKSQNIPLKSNPNTIISLPKMESVKVERNQKDTTPLTPTANKVKASNLVDEQLVASNNKEASLPQTGNEENKAMAGAGAMLVGLGSLFGLSMFRRRKEN